MTTLIPERNKGKQEMNSEDATSSKETMHISEEYNSIPVDQLFMYQSHRHKGAMRLEKIRLG